MSSYQMYGKPNVNGFYDPVERERERKKGLSKEMRKWKEKKDR